MTIEINTDKTIQVHQSFHEKLNEIISEDLDRFADHITRIEVHLSDENGNKESPNDIKCLLEARIKGRQPVAVTALGHNEVLAVKSALVKLKASLDTIVGRMNEHH